MQDTLLKAFAFNDHIRVYVCRTTELVNEAVKRHRTLPTASAALGRMLSATAMMGAMLKGDSRIMVRIDGDGPIGAMLADANAKGEVRGYPTNPHVDLPLNPSGKLDVRGAVGSAGTLQVIKDIGVKDYFTGQVPITSGELGEDFTYYFTVSEQIPSAVGVGVLVNPDLTIAASGGFILQVLPETPLKIIEELEKTLGKIPPISTLLSNGMTPSEVLYEICGQDVRILEEMPLRFHCSCSKDRYAVSIMGLGKEEIQEMIEEDGQAEAVCHFCNEKYVFQKNELENLIDQINRK